MNILLVSEVYLPTVSGVASSSDSIARFMAGEGHHVTVVCPKSVVAYDPPKQDNLAFVYTPTFRDPFFVDKSMAVFPMGLWELWRVIATRHIDIVHIQEPGTLGVTALLLTKLYRLPTVGAMHFSMEQINRIVYPFLRPFSAAFMRVYIRLIYPQYTAIMMPTETVTKDLAAMIGHKEKIHAVSNGVDTTVYVPRKGSYARLRSTYTLDPTAIYALYLGRLDADKNIETILRAFAKTPKTLRLILAGVGKQQVSLEKLATDLKLQSRITWIKNLSQQHIIELYQLSDMFVIMSPVETQSIVTLQAIACGLPVIAANAGALPELVRDGESGYLLPTFDENLLAEKMTYLATYKDVRMGMGTKSRELSLAHHKPTVLKKLEELYEQVKKG